MPKKKKKAGKKKPVKKIKRKKPVKKKTIKKVKKFLPMKTSTKLPSKTRSETILELLRESPELPYCKMPKE